MDSKEKNELKSLLNMLVEQIDKDCCTEYQLEHIHNIMRKAFNPLMTRNEAISFFKKSADQFDNEVSRKLCPKAKKRNIVLYPFQELYKIFNR